MLYIEIKNNRYPVLDIETFDSGKLIFIKNITYQEIKELFTFRVSWSTIDQWGDDIDESELYDVINCDEYCVPGQIVDYGDGTFSIEMKKLIAQDIFGNMNLRDAQDFVNDAIKLRDSMIDNINIYEYKNLFPVWDSNKEYYENNIIRYENKLYKILENHHSINISYPNDRADIYELLEQEV